jgi:hypothetical protein
MAQHRDLRSTQSCHQRRSMAAIPVGGGGVPAAMSRLYFSSTLHTNKVGPGTTTTSIHCDASTSKAQTLSCRCLLILVSCFLRARGMRRLAPLVLTQLPDNASSHAPTWRPETFTTPEFPRDLHSDPRRRLNSPRGSAPPGWHGGLGVHGVALRLLLRRKHLVSACT